MSETAICCHFNWNGVKRKYIPEDSIQIFNFIKKNSSGSTTPVIIEGTRTGNQDNLTPGKYESVYGVIGLGKFPLSIECQP